MTIAANRRDMKERKDCAMMRRLPHLFGLETLSAFYIRQNFKPHAHDEYMFGVIESGVHAVWCRGEMNLAPAGTVVTMRPGDVHYGGAGHKSGWRQRMLYINEAALRDIFSDIADQDVAPPLDFDVAFHAKPGLAKRFSQLHEVLHSSDQALAQDIALDKMIQILLQELSPTTIPEKSPLPVAHPIGRIADAIDYLESRVDEDVTLTELCAISGLRRRQTIAAFQRYTGLPPHAWHIQRKIERVKSLLRAGLSCTQAAAQTGFADQSHMARHFSAIVGLTPGIYARG